MDETAGDPQVYTAANHQTADANDDEGEQNDGDDDDDGEDKEAGEEKDEQGEKEREGKGEGEEGIGNSHKERQEEKEETFDFNILPKSLTELELWRLEVSLVMNCLPSQLKYLKIYKPRIEQSLNIPGIFPCALESLVIGRDPNASPMTEPFQPNILPSSLKHLETDYLFEDYPIGMNVLPSSLEKLYLGSQYNQPIDEDVLSQTLIELDLGEECNHPIGKKRVTTIIKNIIYEQGFSIIQLVKRYCHQHSKI